jgi:Cytochrome oxidase complex assembly protein 1
MAARPFPAAHIEFAFMNSGYIPAPPPPALTLPKSWFSRNWKWFVPTLVLGLVLLIAAAVGALLTFVFGLLKSSEPYQHAVAVASSNPDVVRELGAPIAPGWFASGSIQVSANSGDANLSIPLNGKLRHGTVYVVAKKTDGVWSYDKLEMLVEGRDRIELLPHPPPQPEDK